MPQSILFKNVILVDGQMTKAQRADMLIKGGVISSIKAPGTINDTAVEIFDGKGSVALMPGLVNAHSHLAMSILRGLGEGLPLMTWLKDRIWPIEALMTTDDVYTGTKLSVAEMAINGVTCVSDFYFGMERVPEAIEAIGLRGGIARAIVGNEDERIGEALALADSCKGSCLIKVQIAPHAPYTVGFDALCRVAQLARERNMGVHFHFLEAEFERGYIQEEFGMTPYELLDKTGLLDVPSLILDHCVYLNEEEIIALSKFSNVTVAHCMGSNLKLGSGIALVETMYQNKLNVALGTDGAASNNRLDIWDEMRLVALVPKGKTKDPTIISSKDILNSATYAGAKALGFEKLGLIAEGWMADFVAIDLSRTNYVGADEENLCDYIVYAGNTSDVIGTIVDGKWIYKDGKLLTHDLKDLVEEATKCRNNLTSKLAQTGMENLKDKEAR